MMGFFQRLEEVLLEVLECFLMDAEKDALMVKVLM